MGEWVLVLAARPHGRGLDRRRRLRAARG